MTQISGKTLALSIQAVDAEILRLRSLSDHSIVSGDQLLLVDLENAAEELREVYDVLLQTHSNMPPYEQLILEVLRGLRRQARMPHLLLKLHHKDAKKPRVP